MGDFARSREYDSFRSSIPQKKIVVDGDEDRTWIIYDAGPREIRCPLVFLPPASGRATVFYKQLLTLSAAGYRVIALDYPVYWNMKQWNEGFCKLIDYLRLDKIHVFGASLGGYLAQKFAESTYLAQRVHSLILCNSFSDTSIFQQSNSAPAYWMLPGVLLKKMIMGNFERGRVDKAIAASVDFMVDSLDSLGQQELASRLTLNCMNSYVEAHKLGSIPVTIIDVLDSSALSISVKDDMYKCYPTARRAHLKDGGNFPYLSRAEEVNVYIQIHLKNFWGSKESALSSDREMEMLTVKSTVSDDGSSN